MVQVPWLKILPPPDFSEYKKSPDFAQNIRFPFSWNPISCAHVNSQPTHRYAILDV